MDSDTNLETFLSFVLLFTGACLSPLFKKNLEPHLNKALDVIYISYVFTVFVFVMINVTPNQDDHISDAHKMVHLFFVPTMGVISIISLFLSIANIKRGGKKLRRSTFCLNYIIIPG